MVWCGVWVHLEEYCYIGKYRHDDDQTSMGISLNVYILHVEKDDNIRDLRDRNPAERYIRVFI